MELNITSDTVDFVWEGKLAGRYVYRDEYKPYLHPLNTPEGHTLSLAMPHDHKHHKGLMYALRASDVNFWEERVATPGEIAGREHHDGFDATVERGDVVGFEESLTWLAHDGTLTTFLEKRSVYCRVVPDPHAFEWTWSTELEARREVELVMSQWSKAKSDGVSVNYHGLGLRLRRDFGCTGGNRLVLDELETSFEDGLGKTPGEAVFEGSLDGIWPIQKAGISFSQSQQNPLFIMDKPFAFLSLGPTNLVPMTLGEGQRLAERYVVTVFDGVWPSSRGGARAKPPTPMDANESEKGETG